MGPWAAWVQRKPTSRFHCHTITCSSWVTTWPQRRHSCQLKAHPSTQIWEPELSDGESGEPRHPEAANHPPVPMGFAPAEDAHCGVIIASEWQFSPALDDDRASNTSKSKARVAPSQSTPTTFSNKQPSSCWVLLCKRSYTWEAPRGHSGSQYSLNQGRII